MGKHTGDRPAVEATHDRRALLLHGLAVLGAFIAWVLLVWYAIHLGGPVKRGEIVPMLLFAIACLGAMACLFLGLVQGRRLSGLLREPAATPVQGRRVRR